RRRHTRSDRDWSSDVCSSDLLVKAVLAELLGGGELFLKVLLLTTVNKTLALEEVDEHQPVQHDAGQPRAVVGMGDVLGGVGEGRSEERRVGKECSTGWAREED